MSTRKIDDTTIEITRDVPMIARYELGYLRRQLLAVQDQKTRDIIQRDAEIADLEFLISEAVRLGVRELSVLPETR